MNNVIDILIRIKNAYLARHKNLEVPHSKLKENLVKILTENGYLKEYRVVGEKSAKSLQLTLKYEKKEPIITDIKIISRPGLKIYTKSNKIGKVFGGNGISIISTPKGLMTGKEAGKNNLGGELICQVW